MKGTYIIFERSIALLGRHSRWNSFERHRLKHQRVEHFRITHGQDRNGQRHRYDTSAATARTEFEKEEDLQV